MPNLGLFRMQGFDHRVRSLAAMFKFLICGKEEKKEMISQSGFILPQLLRKFCVCGGVLFISYVITSRKVSKYSTYGKSPVKLADWYTFEKIKKNFLRSSPLISLRSRCYLVTRCTNLVSVHYFWPLAIFAKMLVNKVASGNWACVNGI